MVEYGWVGGMADWVSVVGCEVLDGWMVEKK